MAVPLFMNTSSQTVRLTESNVSFTREFTDMDGNLGAVPDLDPRLAPGEAKALTATFMFQRSRVSPPEIDPADAQSISQVPDGLIDEYCVPTETFMMDDPLIASKAEELTQGSDTVLESVSALLTWFSEESTYTNFENPRYPNLTLTDMKGDCDDQSILFASMCRSLGIPAYLQVGVIFINVEDSGSSWDGHLVSSHTGVGWHAWAMVYVPPWGWLPVDLTLAPSVEPLDLIRNAPQYRSSIIRVMNVSEQSYVGEALAQQNRITDSTLYVTLIEEGVPLASPMDSRNLLKISGLAGALAVAIVLMFITGRSSKHGS